MTKDEEPFKVIQTEATALIRIAVALERIARRLDSWDTNDLDHDGCLAVKDFTS